MPSKPGADAVTPGYRIRLHVDGVRMFGPGTHEYLRHVDKTGSLHQAAKLMGMSYAKAWTLLRKTEEHLCWPLVERHIGGAVGAGTSLTKTGRDLLQRVDRFVAETDAAMQEAFEAAFGDWSSPGEPQS